MFKPFEAKLIFNSDKFTGVLQAVWRITSLWSWILIIFISWNFWLCGITPSWSSDFYSYVYHLLSRFSVLTYDHKLCSTCCSRSLISWSYLVSNFSFVRDYISSASPVALSNIYFQALSGCMPGKLKFRIYKTLFSIFGPLPSRSVGVVLRGGFSPFKLFH